MLSALCRRSLRVGDGLRALCVLLLPAAAALASAALGGAYALAAAAVFIALLLVAVWAHLPVLAAGTPTSP